MWSLQLQLWPEGSRHTSFLRSNSSLICTARQSNNFPCLFCRRTTGECFPSCQHAMETNFLILMGHGVQEHLNFKVNAKEELSILNWNERQATNPWESKACAPHSWPACFLPNCTSGLDPAWTHHATSYYEVRKLCFTIRKESCLTAALSESPLPDYLEVVGITALFPDLLPNTLRKWQPGAAFPLPYFIFLVFRCVPDLNTKKSPSFNDSKSQPIL